VNRRDALTGLGSGAALLSLLRTKSAEAMIVYSPGDPRQGTGLEFHIDGLPPGMVELESVVQTDSGDLIPSGEIMTVPVDKKGRAVILYRPVQLLRGMWGVSHNFVTKVATATEITVTPPAFNLILEMAYPATPAQSYRAALYRNPADGVGTVLRGTGGSLDGRMVPMVLWVHTPYRVNPLTIQLMSLDFAPKIAADLRKSITPPWGDVIQEWSFPVGSGWRKVAVPALKIPWDTRGLALRLASPQVTQSLYIRLGSGTSANGLGAAPLEIGCDGRPC